jgi:hypothetical protein
MRGDPDFGLVGALAGLMVFVMLAAIGLSGLVLMGGWMWAL